MDRYEDEKEKEVKQTRTSKNQELYTDVYLNNVYVNIEDLKDVMDDDKNIKVEEKKKRKDLPTDYSYQEKNYDIVSIIEEKIASQEKDNVKRSYSEEHKEELDNLVESLNASKFEKDKDETLLSDLMPDHDTTVIEPLEKPIVDTSLIDTDVIKKTKNEELDDTMVKEIEEDEELEADKSFVFQKTSKKKIIFIVLGIVLLLALVVGILIWKGIIKI